MVADLHHVVSTLLCLLMTEYTKERHKSATIKNPVLSYQITLFKHNLYKMLQLSWMEIFMIFFFLFQAQSDLSWLKAIAS